MSKEKVEARDLQCCGNCIEYSTCDRFNDPRQWCDDWKWDTLIRAQREKEREEYED